MTATTPILRPKLPSRPGGPRRRSPPASVAAVLLLLSAVVVRPTLAFVNVDGARAAVGPTASPPTIERERGGGACRGRNRDPPLRPVARLSASPSGIDELPLAAQAATFCGVYAALGIGTLAGTKILDAISANAFGLERWREYAVEAFLPVTLGITYLAAGAGHFLAADAFREIYPPPGTWGLWYIPGSAAFHVAWTGAAEILGGTGLLYGFYQFKFGGNEDEDEGDLPLKLVQPASALALFVLTILVTPSNIYMFTHGANLGADLPAADIQFHVIRFILQVILLSELWVLAKDSFFYVWGDELD